MFLILHESAEDYLETILMLKERLGMVRSIDIVKEKNFKKPLTNPFPDGIILLSVRDTRL